MVATFQEEAIRSHVIQPPDSGPGSQWYEVSLTIHVKAFSTFCRSDFHLTFSLSWLPIARSR